MDPNIEAEARLRERNAAGRVRSRVLRVLELSAPQIRDYLDRPQPKADEALAVLSHIEDLIIELQGGTIEGIAENEGLELKHLRRALNEANPNASATEVIGRAHEFQWAEWSGEEV